MFSGRNDHFRRWKGILNAASKRAGIAVAFLVLSPAQLAQQFPDRTEYTPLRFPGDPIQPALNLEAAGLALHTVLANARTNAIKAYHTQQTSIDLFLRDILAHLPESARLLLEPSEADLSLTIPSCLALLTVHYGTFTPANLDANNILLSMEYSGTDTIANHVTFQANAHAISDDNGDPHSEYYKCKALLDSCRNHPSMATVVADFVKSHQTIASRTFAAASAFLIAAKGTMPPTASSTASSTGFTAAATTPVGSIQSLQAQLTALAADLHTLKSPPAKTCKFHPLSSSHTTAECVTKDRQSTRTPDQRKGGKPKST